MKIKNLSDWAVALIVITCSAVLFAALAMALSGVALGKPARTLRVNFADVTGISVGARVKYAGASAGTVSAIRMLSLEERKTSGNPLNAVEVTLGLNRNVPPLPENIQVAVASDTLLSDKFVLLTGGSIEGPDLADNAVVQGITPVGFDQLARNLDGAIGGIGRLMSGAQGKSDDLISQVRKILGDVNVVVTEVGSLVNSAQPVVKDVELLTTDVRKIVTANQERVGQALVRLDNAAKAVEELARRGDGLIQTNEKKIALTLEDFRIISENLKVTSTYSKFLTRNLVERPNRLLWGGRGPALPTEQEILRLNKPYPLP